MIFSSFLRIRSHFKDFVRVFRSPEDETNADGPLKNQVNGLFEQFVLAPQERKTNANTAWGSEWDLYRLGKIADAREDPLVWWRAKQSELPTLGVFSFISFSLLSLQFLTLKQNLRSCIWASLPLKQAVSDFSAS